MSDSSLSVLKLALGQAQQQPTPLHSIYYGPDMASLAWEFLMAAENRKLYSAIAIESGHKSCLVTPRGPDARHAILEGVEDMARRRPARTQQVSFDLLGA